ncbi:hypothetical protein EDD22DRAFT_912406 [Suillus occidentalis]|nr:hypothetical protein EDD22DRAFT_912406 [Suillus occidentalis]
MWSSERSWKGTLVVLAVDNLLALRKAETERPNKTIEHCREEPKSQSVSVPSVIGEISLFEHPNAVTSWPVFEAVPGCCWETVCCLSSDHVNDASWMCDCNFLV